jgi:hypothetical protein
MQPPLIFGEQCGGSDAENPAKDKDLAAVDDALSGLPALDLSHAEPAPESQFGGIDFGGVHRFAQAFPQLSPSLWIIGHALPGHLHLS